MPLRNLHTSLDASEWPPFLTTVKVPGLSLPKGPECLQRKGGGQGKGPDRISQQRPVDQRKICRGTGEERTENPYARGGLSG